MTLARISIYESPGPREAFLIVRFPGVVPYLHVSPRRRNPTAGLPSALSARSRSGFPASLGS